MGVGPGGPHQSWDWGQGRGWLTLDMAECSLAPASLLGASHAEPPPLPRSSSDALQARTHAAARMNCHNLILSLTH